MKEPAKFRELLLLTIFSDKKLFIYEPSNTYVIAYLSPNMKPTDSVQGCGFHIPI